MRKIMFPSPAPHVCWLYLLRHGATDYNLRQPPVLQGRTVNLGLAPVGKRQAELAADFLATAPLQAIYASPLKRAIETAQPLAAKHSLQIGTREELMEVDVGRWESRSWVEIMQTEPEAYRAFQRDPGTHGYAGGENLLNVQERAAPVIEELLAKHVGQSIAIVGHNVVNRTFIARILGLPLIEAKALIQENGCINLIKYQSGEATLHTLNATFHLYER
jgi:broad specificity phosphatase PhoE